MKDAGEIFAVVQQSSPPSTNMPNEAQSDETKRAALRSVPQCSPFFTFLPNAYKPAICMILSASALFMAVCCAEDCSIVLGIVTGVHECCAAKSLIALCGVGVGLHAQIIISHG